MVILFIAAQFVRPDRTNPPVDRQLDVHAAAQVPPKVSALLKRSCFDCHSNETVWPWYTNVTPVNWWIVESHVEHGRNHHNFSEWGKQTPGEQENMFEDICKEVQAGAMPLPSYLYVHGDARLSDSDKRAICDWTRAERERLAPKSPAEPERKEETPHTHKH
jgi:hypothetical protein